MSIGEYKRKAGYFITVVGISFNGLHTTAKWYLYAVQIASVSASVWCMAAMWRAAFANGIGSCGHPWFAQ